MPPKANFVVIDETTTVNMQLRGEPMKKLFLFIAAMIVAMPVLVQADSIGVYFDTDGTSNFLLSDEFVNEAYVVVFAESMIAGAAFKLTMDPHQSLLNTVYPAGLQIGEPLTGVELGMTDPVVGYYNNPAVVATLTLMTVNFGELTNLNIVTHPAYESVIYADHTGVVFDADGLSAVLSATVSNDSASFGEVKNLFR